MVESTGSDNLGGLNQSADNDFGNYGFWFEWIELSGAPSNLTDAGFNTADGSISAGTNVYNAGGTDDLDGLATDASASTLGDDVSGDRSLFAIRATTTLTVTDAGTYTFDVRSDDGAILYVDGVQVVNDDSLHAPRTRSGDIALGAGEHEIVIIYFERTGQNVLEVDISSDAAGDYPTSVRLQDANVQANAGDDTVNALGGNDSVLGGTGDDSLDGGDGSDTLDGGADNDTLTGGAGDDVFVVSSGTDTITDFGAGNSGSTTDGDPTNNDFIDLSGFYNPTTLDAVNNADADPGNDFGNPLEMLRADAADGTIDGVINGVDYSAQIGDIDLTIENGGAPVPGTALTVETTNVVCFTRGTRIMTAAGPVPVERLAVGDLIQTQDDGCQPIRWTGSQAVCADTLAACPWLRPVRIKAGTLGDGLPRQDLRVSPQHRLLVRSKIAQRMFGTRQVLVSAKKLLLLPGIDIDDRVAQVEYFHFMFDRHQVIFANGAPAESLLPGPQALATLSAEASREILTLFPEIADLRFQPRPAALIPDGKRQKKLVDRHIKNDQVLIG